MEEEFYIAESDLTTSMKVIRFYFHRISPLTPRLATRLFWHLFTKPRSRKFSSTDKKFYEEVKSQEFKSDKFNAPYTLHKKGGGDKKVLVLHGWEGRSSDFSKLINQLSESATIYSLDFPGHGVSPRSRAHLPMFIDVIQSVLNQFEKIDVVLGHSLGAASLAIAVGRGSYESKVNQLLFLGLHPEPSQYFLQYKRVTKVSESVFNRCVTLAQRKTGAQLLDYNCYDHLDEFEKFRVYFIHDEDDKIIHVNRVEDLSNRMSYSEVYKGDHGGHFRHYKHKDVIQRINSIVKGH